MKVILDLDETLIDTLDRQFGLLNNLLNSKKIKLDKLSYYALKKQGISNKDILLKNNLDRDLVDLLHLEYVNLIESKDYLKCDKLICNFELLKDFSIKHEIHLCSMRSNKYNSQIQLNRLAISDFFRTISWVPHKTIVKKDSAVKKIQEIYGPIDYFVGDSDVDEMAAIKNNIKFIKANRYVSDNNIDKILSNL